jgi:hypothetical protein
MHNAFNLLFINICIVRCKINVNEQIGNLLNRYRYFGQDSETLLQKRQQMKNERLREYQNYLQHQGGPPPKGPPVQPEFPIQMENSPQKIWENTKMDQTANWDQTTKLDQTAKWDQTAKLDEARNVFSPPSSDQQQRRSVEGNTSLMMWTLSIARKRRQRQSIYGCNFCNAWK